MREQQVLEVELRGQSPVRLAEPLLGPLGLVHELVGHERELPVRLPPHRPVGEGESVAVTLTFETAGTVTVDLPVLGTAADEAAGGGHHGH